MTRIKIFLIIVLSVCISCIAYAGDTNRKLTLTLEDAISMAHDNSPEVQAARHTYRAAYWNYRSFRANYLPSVSLISNPYLNRQINKITQPDGTEQFIRQNKLSTDLGLQISQNVSFTGGNFFVQTSTQRNHLHFSRNLLTFTVTAESLRQKSTMQSFLSEMLSQSLILSSLIQQSPQILQSLIQQIL